MSRSQGLCNLLATLLYSKDRELEAWDIKQ